MEASKQPETVSLGMGGLNEGRSRAAGAVTLNRLLGKQMLIYPYCRIVPIGKYYGSRVCIQWESDVCSRI